MADDTDMTASEFWASRDRGVPVRVATSRAEYAQLISLPTVVVVHASTNVGTATTPMHVDTPSPGRWTPLVHPAAH